MSELKTIVKNARSKFMPDWQQKLHEKTDIAGMIIPDPPSPPPAPVAEPVVPMPDPEASKQTKRRSAATQRARSGRASTIFSDGLGG